MKTTKRNLVLLFILLFNTVVQVCAQETTTLTGKVIDAQTGKPVSYASAEIISKHLGAAANAGGILQFAISESMIDETLTFSALAYFTRQVTVKELLENQPFVVELERNDKYYYEIIAGGQPQLVYSQSMGIILGHFTPNIWGKYLSYDWYFDNEKNTGKIKGGFTNSLINSEVDCFK